MTNKIIAVAPMLDWTDRHARYFLRLMSQHTLLYTEMINTGAILRGDRDYCLGFDNSEHPIALQLGGSSPHALAQCAVIAEQYRYDEINLNVGCPSDRVQSGHFGACLMQEPQRIADCVAAMQQAVSIPITIKCRNGIDRIESYHFLKKFVATTAPAGCQTFIVHARNAWLQGLSPKENRHVPPLNYEFVYRLKQDFPELTIIINGGIQTTEQIKQHLHHVDGVMIGREAYHNPYCLATIDRDFYHDDHAIPSRQTIAERYIDYIEKQLKNNVKLHYMTRHILGLFQGQAGARNWRRYLSEHSHQATADAQVVREALRLIN
ncbi:MAG: tRNA dihydrouridine(20/20a) synthase DusA [Gammaproteobacteria bacterium]|nr:tRNA dihydrouridine(20/20a) synthase DusA [Gammaproteobacteria bacterium]